VANNTGALQLLFEHNIFPEIDVERGAQEFSLTSFKENMPFMDRLNGVLWILPIVAFGMEVTRLRQTSYQAIHETQKQTYIRMVMD